MWSSTVIAGKNPLNIQFCLNDLISALKTAFKSLKIGFKRTLLLEN